MGEGIRSRPGLAWLIVIVVVYGAATLATSLAVPPRIDQAFVIAQHLLRGDASLGSQPGALDTVTRNGLAYHVIGIGPILPYIPLAPFDGLASASRWITSLVVGIVAAWLALPLVRAYGPRGRARWWLASLVAFGTLLLPLTARGSFFYLAHLEAMAATTVALVEWRGRRRAWVVALAIGLAGLARPTVLLALVPFGAALLWRSRARLRTALELLVPAGAIVVAIGAWNLVRFGSPLETGYATSTLTNEVLLAARTRGMFALSHVPRNLAMLVGGGFELGPRFPWLLPNPYGHSILLTTPALLAAAQAPWRNGTSRLLLGSAALVIVPLLLYYGGGGFHTYGYRYAMDAMPFLLALVALAARRRFGRLEQALIVLSIGFCGYGVVAGILRVG